MSRLQLSLALATSFVVCSIACAQNPVFSSSTPVSEESNAENIPLPPVGDRSASSTSGGTSTPTTGRTLTTVVGALAVCLGVFFILVWITKRHAPAGLAPLPKEVVESLGRASLNSRQQLQLLRIGRKLVLLHVTSTTAETLTEIVDPAEVDRLVGLCQQTSPNSVTASFREVLTHYEAEPAKGFLGEVGQSDWELATRGNSKRLSRREEIDV
jgi:flagellar biogenesis protein FliO